MAYNFPEEEKKILQFWAENNIFEKLREKNKGKKRWSFLDGPITANNPMGVHHAWGRTYKDLFQRYFAAKGFDERYQNGFDCQGLWVEVEVEKELGFKTKKDIEAYGIDKFVEKCKERVRKYAAIQTAQSVRLGQWMDWENSYYTMSDENNYAIWHFLKKCWELGYLYKGRDSVPWCPRCGTAISQHEILTEEYKEITHESIYFRLPITGTKNEYLLVWTTTPWTLPANIAVAVDKTLDYSLVEDSAVGGASWVAKDLVSKIFGDEPKILKTVKGSKLVGLQYTFAFDELPRVREVSEKSKKFHTVVATDNRIMPITTEEGTGMVHTAVSAGEEDFKLGKKLDLPLIEVIDEEANYIDGLGEFSGKNAKKDPKIILDYLASKENFVFKIEKYKHRYPTCWRCKTELVWRVVDEWYISMEKLRKPLMEITKKINWIPEFGREREIDWLKNMHDWLISKKRYWGLALPIFECKECGNFEVIGSKEELKKRAVEGWAAFAGEGEPRVGESGREGNSPHRPWIDNIKINCKKCPGRKATEDPRLQSNRDKSLMSRIKDVGNPWLDAGIVPFSTMNYLDDKSYWKKWFPAEIVSESFPGQFKNWFYSILVMAAVLEETAPVKTIFGYGLVKDEKGEEMHKSKGNAIWFDDAVEKVGADPIRWFYMRQNPAENANFGYTPIEEIKRKLLTLYNVYTFFGTYVPKNELPEVLKIKPKNVLDRWIISKLEHVISLVEFNMEKYDVTKAVSAIEDFFINDLSLWYVRRSRKRFHLPAVATALQAGESSPDRTEAITTLYYVLLHTAKIISPVIPFFAEAMFQTLRNEKLPESVHLQDWPGLKGHTDLDLEEKMDEVRMIVAGALAERSLKAIKIRQPLATLKVSAKGGSASGGKNQKSKIKDSDELLDLIKDEVNVKEVVFDDSIEHEVELDTNLTQELKDEGTLREIIRSIQDMRKEAGLKPQDVVSLAISSEKEIQNLIEKHKETITSQVRVKEISFEKEISLGKQVILGEHKIIITIKQ